MEPRPRKLVVAALIFDGQGAVLLTRRRADQDLPGLWELPGGKVEPGEAPAAALARELREEVDVDLTVGPIWDVLFHAYPAYDVYMLVYRCSLETGQAPRPVEVAEVAWVPIALLDSFNILPADQPLLARLRRESET